MILDRIDGTRFSRVLRRWHGKTVVLIGGGPSLNIGQIELVRTSNCMAIAVNNGYLLAPWADVCYFADSKWWRWNHEGFVYRDETVIGLYECAGLTSDEVKAKFRGFAGQKCSIQNSGANIKDATVHILKNKTYPEHANGLSTEQDALVTGRNSGFQALNLAVLAGATKILLLGYDGKAKDGKSHWFGEHPTETPASAMKQHRESFAAAVAPLKKLGVEVLNCSPGSAIDVFPYVPLERAL